MKKILALTLSLTLAGYLVNAQQTVAALHGNEKMLAKEETSLRKEKHQDRKELREIRDNEVSAASKEQFFRDFGNITVLNWKRENGFDVATFRANGKAESAYYDAHNELVGTTMHKTFADIPAAAQKTIKKDYKGYVPGPVIFFDDNEANDTDMALYGQPFDDADNYFVELYKGTSRIVVQADMRGNVSFFKKL